ncbi:MAG: CoA-binding protein, partial [Anaerolineales bacterium]|nr:CoA-binding protein [Anaerolineales bacterium]
GACGPVPDTLMDTTMTDKDQTMRRILERDKTIAVVGFSHSRARAGYYVPAYLHKHGYRIIPVNPYIEEALGEKAYASLLDIPDKVDLVEVFRRPEFIPQVVDEAIQIGARSIWLQLGIRNDVAAKTALEAGLDVVQDACMMVEHRRLMV